MTFQFQNILSFFCFCISQDSFANWYSKIIMKVKWENCYSSSCMIKSGVRQGGVLSPVLFNVYFNVIVNSLQHSKLGCELYGEYIGCLV